MAYLTWNLFGQCKLVLHWSIDWSQHHVITLPAGDTIGSTSCVWSVERMTDRNCKTLTRGLQVLSEIIGRTTYQLYTDLVPPSHLLLSSFCYHNFVGTYRKMIKMWSRKINSNLILSFQAILEIPLLGKVRSHIHLYRAKCMRRSACMTLYVRIHT